MFVLLQFASILLLLLYHSMAAGILLPFSYLYDCYCKNSLVLIGLGIGLEPLSQPETFGCANLGFDHFHIPDHRYHFWDFEFYFHLCLALVLRCYQRAWQ